MFCKWVDTFHLLPSPNDLNNICIRIVVFNTHPNYDIHFHTSPISIFPEYGRLNNNKLIVVCFASGLIHFISPSRVPNDGSNALTVIYQWCSCCCVTTTSYGTTYDAMDGLIVVYVIKLITRCRMSLHNVRRCTKNNGRSTSVGLRMQQ